MAFNNFIKQNYMSLITSRPYPIKICYLKQQPKPAEIETQQKVSLTFLSSFIQQQKHSSALQNKQQNSFITMTEQPQSIDLLQSGTKPTHVLTMQTHYQKWRKRIARSSVDDHRLLTNLIGTQWENQNASNQVKLPLNKKNRKTIRDRMQTLQNDERKKENKKLMENHFRTFLSDKKPNLTRIQPQQKNCFVTKVDQRAKKNTYPIFMPDQFQGCYFRNRTVNSTPNQKKKRLESKTRANISLIGPGLRKKGFQQMANFNWSKLDVNQKFKLSDHS